jgi:aspartyl-tRNA(Asn)/glutamyl-tRNA(Gln) amidotransferase subunit A
MSMVLNKLTITEALAGLQSRQFSCRELVEDHISAIEAHGHLNAFITKSFERALEQAELSEQKLKLGQAGRLESIPLAIKDIYCTADVRTTCASKMLENFIPTYESTVTAKLWNAGAVMLGKTNMDEFAMGSTNMYSHFGAVINPWREKDSEEVLIPGGSSGGSAVAVAARMSMGALGTDTGGSIRQPAAMCGVVGFKPSYGRCSRYGIVAFASSLDQAGVFARSIDDAALLSEVIMGFDDRDATSMNLPLPDLSAAARKNIRGLRIGIPREYDMPALDPEIKKLWSDTAQALAEDGAEIIDVSLPNTKYGVASYYVIAPAEAASNLARFDGVRYGLREYKEGMTLDEMYEATRGAGFGAEVERRIMVGTYVLSAESYNVYFAQAQKVRRLIANDFKAAFEKVDALLTPVTTSPAYSMQDKARLDPVAMYFNDVFTIPVNMAGLPGLSVPCRLTSKGLPISLQVIGNRFDEEMVFRVGKAVERYANFESLPTDF